MPSPRRLRVPPNRRATRRRRAGTARGWARAQLMYPCSTDRSVVAVATAALCWVSSRAATAASCARRRAPGDSPRRSSSQETAASPAPASATTAADGGTAPAAHSASQTTTLVPITAMPPPRGVGTTCDERSFGRSSTARRRSSATSTRVPRQDATNDTAAAKRSNNNAATPGSSRDPQAEPGGPGLQFRRRHYRAWTAGSNPAEENCTPHSSPGARRSRRIAQRTDAPLVPVMPLSTTCCVFLSAPVPR